MKHSAGCFCLRTSLVRCHRWTDLRRYLLLVLLGLLLTFAPSAKPAEYLKDWARMKGITPRHYVCGRAGEPIQIDGKLDDPAWHNAAWTEDFVDIEGTHRPRPRFRTRAKMLWDDQYFYVAAELEEPHVWGTLTNHDSVIFNDPDFEVFIDPDGDSHEYYEFEMNALNTGWDLFLKKPYKDGGSAMNEWEIPGLRTAVHIDGTLNNPADHDRGWTLEIAFPWPALGQYANRPAPPEEGDQWRVGFSRVEWRIDTHHGRYQKVPNKKEDNWIWSAQGIIDMHRPEKWGYVQFTRKPPKEVRFRRDDSAPARSVLQEIYYTQRDSQKKNGRWASQLEELSLSSRLGAGLAAPLRLEVTPEGFTATAEIRSGTGPTQRWHIRQDARVWKD
jgi:hypothetical protein